MLSAASSSTSSSSTSSSSTSTSASASGLCLGDVGSRLFRGLLAARDELGREPADCLECLDQPLRPELQLGLARVGGVGRGGELLDRGAELLLEQRALGEQGLPLFAVKVLLLGEEARLFLGLRLGLGRDDLQPLELRDGAVALGLEGDLRVANTLRLPQQLPGLLELGRQVVALLDDGAQLGRRAVPYLGQDVLESLDLGAKLVALLGGGAEDGEPFERVAELLLEPLALGRHLVALRPAFVALRRELVALDGVPLLLLGQPALLLHRGGLRLGECRLQLVELLTGALALLAEPGELLLVRGLRLGEDALEAGDVALQPLALGGGRVLRLGE